MTAKAAKITTSRNLQAFLRQVVEEGVKSALAKKALAEKENQAKAGGGGDDLDDLFGPGEGGSKDKDNAGGGDEKMPDLGGDDHENKPTGSKTMDDEKEKLQQGDIETKDVVDKLNSIRSGRSFKDSGVEGAMEQYIESLSKSERTALFAFLKGIAQIVTGEVPAQTAEKPDSHPSDIKMDKTNEPHTVTKKPNVIRGPKKSAGKAQPDKKGTPEEDTSAPIQAPITAKKRK